MESDWWISRRAFVGSVAMTIAAGCTTYSDAGGNVEEAYGLIGQIKANPGMRSELVAILLQGTRAMPGNRVYLIAEDLADPDLIWITEVWNTRADHSNSLLLPDVQAAIAKGRPLIAGFGMRAETRPVSYAG